MIALFIYPRRVKVSTNIFFHKIVTNRITTYSIFFILHHVRYIMLYITMQSTDLEQVWGEKIDETYFRKFLVTYAPRHTSTPRQTRRLACINTFWCFFFFPLLFFLAIYTDLVLAYFRIFSVLCYLQPVSSCYFPYGIFSHHPLEKFSLQDLHFCILPLCPFDFYP